MEEIFLPGVHFMSSYKLATSLLGNGELSQESDGSSSKYYCTKVHRDIYVDCWASYILFLKSCSVTITRNTGRPFHHTSHCFT